MYRATSPERRATFLERVADRIEALIVRAVAPRDPPRRLDGSREHR